MIQMLYPERRRVSEETVRGWLADAIANDKLDIDEGNENVNPATEFLDYVLDLLEDTGDFTFARS